MEPQQHVSRPSAIGEELQLHKAVDTPKIRYVHEETIKQALRAIMVKVGLRAANMPDEAEKRILLAFIVENYGNHTVDELNLAFNMAISGRLGVDAKCYENFSCLYFSEIMNAYRLWAKEAIKTKKETIKALPAPPDDGADRDWFYEIKEKYLTGAYAFAILPTVIFDWADGEGMFEGMDKKDFFRQAIEYRRSELLNEKTVPGADQDYINSVLEFLKNPNKENKEYSRLVNLCKKIMLTELFKK